jgi:hypothetical protein
MFVVLWEFDVKSECEDKFTSTYSADGAWAQLFRRDPSFCETRLFRKIPRGASEPLRFVTMDLWQSRADYEHFLHEKSGPYRELDAECAEWTTAERHLSSFDADLPGWGAVL